MERFQGGLVFTAHRLVYHSYLGWRVMKKRRRKLAGVRNALTPLGDRAGRLQGIVGLGRLQGFINVQRVMSRSGYRVDRAGSVAALYSKAPTVTHALISHTLTLTLSHTLTLSLEDNSHSRFHAHALSGTLSL